MDKARKAEIAHRFYVRHKADILLQKKVYHSTHRQENKEYCKFWRETHKEELREYQRNYRLTHRTEIAEGKQRRSQQIKLEVITHYGNGKPACVRCGYTDMRALSIDHIDGGGNNQKKHLQGSFYIWLKESGFPEGFQTLCLNCQWVKRIENDELAHNRLPNASFKRNIEQL